MELVSEKIWRRFSTKGMWVDVIGHALVSRAAEARTEYAVRAEGAIRFWLMGSLHDQRCGKDYGCMRS
jgi:hypothetical protein